MTNQSSGTARCTAPTLTENNIHRTWGDSINDTTKNNHIRIGFQNINGFGYRKDDKHKAEEIFQLMKDHDFDVFAMAETNANWKRISKNNTIWSRTRGWFENQRLSAQHNIHDDKGYKYQPGGTALLTQGDLALRHIASGGDERKLGRWAWQHFRGKNDLRLRIISVYVPHKNHTAGKINAYSQQQDALLKMGLTEDPITLFWNDLWTFVDKCTDNGEQIILAGDWNEDVRTDNFRNKFLERGLLPSITGIHGEDGPETYNRGTNPIDEIFVSANLEISACGYLEHGATLGDHRALWIDIIRSSALGHRLPAFPSHQARRLKTRDPRVAKRYTDFLDDYLTQNDFYPRISNLYQTYSNPMTPSEIEEYEKLDRLREIGMVKAEQQCRHLFMGGKQWSPIFQKARDRIRYFKLSIARMRGRKVHAKTLVQLSKKVGINTVGQSLETQLEHLNLSFQIYKKIRSKHKEHRSTFIESLASALEAHGKGNKATIVRTLLEQEAQRAMFRRIGRILGKGQNLSSTHVTITNEDGSKTDLTKKEDMENAIIDENIKKYHQTEPTCPFHHQPLLDHFGFYGEGPATSSVYLGTYDIPSSVDKYTSTYLDVCAKDPRTQQEGDTTLHRSYQDFHRGWKLMKEKTSSNGNLHFGHFKAALTSPSLTACHYVLAEIPFRTGYSPCRWRKATNVMILKKAGVFDLAKLRTIVLFETDFNHNNKWLGKSMMQHTVAGKQLAKEQYSIPGKKSIDHALNRRLLFDLIRYKKSSLAMTSCDLKSNYDRIAHVPALLAMRRLGIPIEPIQSMFKTIQSIQFTTRTAYGDSARTFGGFDGDHCVPVQGEGQGNGSGPQVWVVVSSAMFEVMRRHGLQTHFSTAISQEELDLCGFAFVDDSDIIASAGNYNNPDATMTRMQEVVDGWEGSAKTTGGALAPDKSWFYLIHFDWEDGKWSYGNLDNVVQNTLSAKDAQDQRVNLQYLSSDVAQEMLGVFLAPDGNNSMQVKTFKQKTMKLAEMIRTGHLDRNEAWTALNTVALKSLEYALPSLTLTEQECISIMWPLLRVLLPKAGITRYISRDVLYGPTHRQGLGLHNMYLTQGNSHVTSIIEHLWKESLTGFFIKSNLEHLRLEIGENGNILEKDFTRFASSILTPSWISHTWNYMTEQGITLADNTAEISPRRQNDVEIMKAVRACSTLSSSEINKFNQCRIYMKAFHLSDILESNGKRISHTAWWGHRNDSTTSSDLDWPLWGQPAKTSWTVWRRVLKKVFCTSVDKQLTSALGHWVERRWGTKWQWFADTQDDQYLYRLFRNKWHRYHKIGVSQLQRRYRNSPAVMQGQPPASIELVPITIQISSPTILLSDGYIRLPSNESASDTTSVTSVSSSPNGLNWLNVRERRSTSIEALVEAIIQGTAVATSDGSFKPECLHGTAGWTIETADGKEFITGMSVSPGPQHAQNAYRSELLGLLAILDRLRILCQQHNITSGRIIISCDGKSALQMGFWRHPDKVQPNEKHSDLLSAISALRKLLPIDLIATHVKGHQDDNKPFSALSSDEQRNIRMDELAKTALQLYGNTQEFTDEFTLHPHSFPSLVCKNNLIFQEVSTSLYNVISSHNLDQYWQKKGRYSAQNASLIDWSVQQRAMKLSSPSRRRFVSKWVSGALGHGKNMKRWRIRPLSNCPFCLDEDEDVNHILHCTHKDSVCEWANNCKKFLLKLKGFKTDPYAFLAIQRCLVQWRMGRDPRVYDHRYHSKLREVLEAQHIIGWRGFADGLLAKQWIPYMASYYAEMGSSRSPHLWASKVIRAAWELSFDTWEERNHRLHETDRIKELEGKPLLEEAIRNEWSVGLGRLPPSEFSYLFSGGLDRTLKGNLTALRRWLAIVRNGRILLDKANVLDDCFIRDESLRKWVGIILVKDGRVCISPDDGTE